MRLLKLFVFGFTLLAFALEAQADRGSHSSGDRGSVSRGSTHSHPSARHSSRESGKGASIRSYEARPGVQGGMATGTHFPRRDIERRSSAGRESTPNMPGGIGPSPSFGTQAPVQNLDRSSSRNHYDRDGDRNHRRDWDGHRRHDHRSQDRDGHRHHHSRSDWRNGDKHHHSHWHGHIRHFKHNHYHSWRHGRWHHGHRGGRIGWWWIVGPSWYFYPATVYPYPDPYVPGPLVLEAQNVEAEPEYWYYCENPQGYYPYVSECLSAWQRVPAEPDSAPPQS